jgi:hypothetical protein
MKNIKQILEHLKTLDDHARLELIVQLVEAAEAVIDDNPGAAYVEYNGSGTAWTPENPGPMYSDFGNLFYFCNKARGIE